MEAKIVLFLREAKKVGSFRLFMNCLNDPIPTFVIKCCKISFSFLSYTYVGEVIVRLQCNKQSSVFWGIIFGYLHI